MSFSVSIKTPTTPSADAVNTPTSGKSAKERALAILTGKANQPEATHGAQDTAVLNPSKVTPEEMGAIRAAAQVSEPAPELGQTDITEAASEPAKAPEATAPATKDEPLSAQYAQLARKEKALRAEAQRLKTEREAIERDRAANKPPEPLKYDPTKHIDRDAFQDPQKALELLSELGLDYNKLTEAQLNSPSPESLELRRTIKAMEAKIAALETEQTGVKKGIEDQRSSSYQQAIKQITNEASKLIYTDASYEMVKATNSVQDVVDLIKRTWDEDNYLMPIEEAAQQVEAYLEEEALKLARLTKIQKKLQPVAATPEAPAKKTADTTQEPKQSQPKTLTNGIGTTRQYTPKERAMFAAQHGPNWRSKVS